MDQQRVGGCVYEYSCILTTWLSVITRSRVSQQDLTDPRGNVPINSLRRPSTWSVVVSSLLPAGKERGKNTCFTVKSNMTTPVLNCPHNCAWCLTSCLLYFFYAELGCGNSSRVMGWGIVLEQEVTASKNGANTLLCCFTNLREKGNIKWIKQY